MSPKQLCFLLWLAFIQLEIIKLYRATRKRIWLIISWVLPLQELESKAILLHIKLPQLSGIIFSTWTQVLCLLFSLVHECPPTSSSIRADCASLFSASACCGDLLWSARWRTCIDVLQTRHSCVNIEPGQAEAWPSAIHAIASAGAGLLDRWLCFVTSDPSIPVLFSSHRGEYSSIVAIALSWCQMSPCWHRLKSPHNFILTPQDSSTKQIVWFWSTFLH